MNQQSKAQAKALARFGLLIHESATDKPLNRVAAYQVFLEELKRAK